jgi:lipase
VLSDPFVAGTRVEVAGGALYVARAGPPPADAEIVVLAVHGITASHLGWRAVTRELLSRRPDICLLAPDLRGRGQSAAVGPPYGIGAHAADLVAVLDDAHATTAVLAGHSMGAFVAARLASERPERVASVVLVDGGLRIPIPPDADPDAVLDAVLGPAIARLGMTFASPEEYAALWRVHPAFAGRWNDDVEAYVRYDLTGEPGAMHSVVAEHAVRADGADVLQDDATLSAAGNVQAPLRLLRAARGLLDDDNPLIPDAVLRAFAAARPDAIIEELADENHYTIVMGSGAQRVTAAIEAAVQDAQR